MTAPAVVTRAEARESRAEDAARYVRALLILAALQQLDREAASFRRRVASLLTWAEWERVLADVLAEYRAAFSLAWSRTDLGYQWHKALTPQLYEAARRGALTFGSSVLKSPALTQIAATEAERAARRILETTAIRLEVAVKREAAALAATDPVAFSPSDLRARVSQRLTSSSGVFSRARAERIGGWESSAAAALGEFTAADTAGFDQCEWLHNGAPKEPRDWHVKLDGTTVNVGDLFPGTSCRFPRDPQGDPRDTFNCTCNARFSRRAA